ncbi:tetratricopeptide repeat protein [Thalassolituus pacificus]|uniref:Sel1 repeat family protein n=1 Tax=Thalassolituus pacificus TaxID=2975440 RepID=A0A9X3ASN3_9GAMM|nr:hypothetical protein [Thalassolituus pacificus]MCT7360199.1 hypothetical protein [Thalassolituus pacificus]
MKYLTALLMSLCLTGCLKEDPNTLVHLALTAVDSEQYQKAEQLLREATEQDYLPAYNVLFNLKTRGLITANDEDSALWLAKSAEHGNRRSTYTMAQQAKAANKHDEYIMWLDKSAYAGNTFAQNELGLFYMNEGNNPEEGLHLLWLSLDMPYDLTPSEVFTSFLHLYETGDSAMRLTAFYAVGQLLQSDEVKFSFRDDQLFITQAGTEYEIPQFKRFAEFAQKGDFRSSLIHEMAYIKASNDIPVSRFLGTGKDVRTLRQIAVFFMYEMKNNPPMGDEPSEARRDTFVSINTNFIKYMNKHCADGYIKCPIISEYVSGLLPRT